VTAALELLNKITDVILAYRPKTKSKKAQKAMKAGRRKKIAAKKND